MRVSTTAVIRRGFAANKGGTVISPLSYLSSSFHDLSHKQRPFSPKPRIDFSCIHEVDDAVFLFREMLGMRPQPSVVHFNKLLSVVVKMKRYSIALNVFDKMRQLGIPVNQWTMNMVINCYCLLNRVDFGFAILGSFFKLGYEPDVTTFTTLIKGLFLDDKVVEAEKLFKNPGQKIDKGISPNTVTYNSVLQGLCNLGKWKDAKDLITEMVDHKVSLNVITFNILVDAFCKEGMVKEAEVVVEIMMQRNISPDVVTYNALIDGYSLVGQIDKARQVFDSMPGRGLKPCVISYNSLINGYCKKGKVEEAWLLFLEVPHNGLEYDVITYNTMLHGLFRAGRFAKGLKVFKDMQAQQGLLKRKLLVEAKTFLDEMYRRGLSLDSDTISLLIDRLQDEGHDVIPLETISKLLPKI
ncbi:UNVERIFIED_CONTAM: putative pentatricopeptide repeat-containing protein, mitochondrial [Sesamum radiatum]|uniref:Pentatricopeptide repeat-containing protein, mitochondrial n=1 Tax=Sesamum radiatum TaxID=300843 RepID=A0AAW2UAI2_SESRA